MENSEAIFDSRDQYQWITRVAKGTLPPLIITVAITGGMQGKEINPNHPESWEEAAEQTLECYKLGASVVHLHCRRRDNPAFTSNDPADYRQLNGLIREKCPEIIINNSTGGGEGTTTAEERIQSLSANPEMCSFNMGPLAFKGMLKKRQEPLSGRPIDIKFDHVAPITFGEIEMFAKVMLEKGIVPEMEVYHHGQWWFVYNLIEKGLIKPPYDIQFCMGISSGSHPTPRNLLHMMDTAPTPSIQHVLGVGHYQTTMITMGILLGIHVRTGMEDNVLYKRRELCKNNAQLVERVVRIARELERDIATPKQARQMLGISEKPSQY